MKMLVSLIALLSAALLANAVPPTCYSRMSSMSKEIMESFKELQTSKDVDECVVMLPKLYVDIHNYCVLAKLREFVAYPRCDGVREVSELKEKVRSLYTLMISYCRKDLVFLTDDCSTLEYPLLPPNKPSITES